MYVLPLLLNVNIKWPVLNTVGLESGIMQGVAENSVCGPRKKITVTFSLDVDCDDKDEFHLLL